MKRSEEDIRAIDWGSPRLNDGRGYLHEMRWTRTKDDRLRDRDRGGKLVNRPRTALTLCVEQQMPPIRIFNSKERHNFRLNEHF